MEWIEVPIPVTLASGPAPQILHYLKANEDWSVYIIEIASDEESDASFMGPNGPIQGRAKWMIIFKRGEVAQGVLRDWKSAKMVSMKILGSLMEGPSPETIPSGNPGFTTRGKGSGN